LTFSPPRLPLAARPPGHGAAQGHRAQGAAALRAVAATAVPYSVGRGARGAEFRNGWDENGKTMGQLT